MDSGIRYVVVLGLALAACFGPGASSTEAQAPLTVAGIYPRQLTRGQTTDISIVVTSADDIQAEITPAQGVTIATITRGDRFQGNHTWWGLAVNAAADAAPGERSLTVRVGGRSTSTAVSIPPHVPSIATLRVLGASNAAPGLNVEATATDTSGDLGDAPYVWFMVACGGMPLPGVVRGTVARQGTGSMVRVTIPRPAPAAGATAATCDLQLRVADSQNNESNALRTTVEASSFGQPAAAGATARPADNTLDGEWTEVVSLEERLSFNIPGKPTIEHAMWFSQYGAVLPARVFTVTRGRSRYVATIVDYNPIERLLVERSRTCPAAANTCQGIADWGIGYWKTDVRGALLYAIATYLERDAKMTSLIWNGIQLVQGVEMRLTNNPDQSRTFSSIYMHENRLVILEGTVPRGDPPPVAFNESLDWLNEQGRPVRYQYTYVNIPDVPKPLPRGAPAPASR
jgi:hypothetical protein